MLLENKNMLHFTLCKNFFSEKLFKRLELLPIIYEDNKKQKTSDMVRKLYIAPENVSLLKQKLKN